MGNYLKKETLRRMIWFYFSRGKRSSISLAIDRVIEIHPGRDSVVRTVKLRTPINKVVRLTNKLYLIEGSND